MLPQCVSVKQILTSTGGKSVIDLPHYINYPCGVIVLGRDFYNDNMFNLS